MKFSFSGDMIVCSLVLAAVLVGFSSAEVEQSKTRRGGGGTAGLFAFPRVGRSDPNLSSPSGSGYDGLFPVSYEEYDDYPKISEIKRANLMAFPRVGRSDSQLRKWARMAALQQSLDKRTAPSANSGLWFGPRLGRIQKRSVDDDELKDFAQKLTSQYEQNSDVEPPLLMDNDDDMILEN